MFEKNNPKLGPSDIEIQSFVKPLITNEKLVKKSLVQFSQTV